MSDAFIKEKIKNELHRLNCDAMELRIKISSTQEELASLQEDLKKVNQGIESCKKFLGEIE